MMRAKIDIGIPIPPKTKHFGKSMEEWWPWRDMQIGDSFLMPKVNSISGKCTEAAKRTGFKFTSRVVEGGLRIWRVK